VEVGPNLSIQEIDVQEEVERYWGDVYKYLALLFNTTGLDEIVAEELAILPGMEEVSALLYLNQYLDEKTYDVLILDCAPTGESLRFISMPSTLDWYMRKIFKLERNIMRISRPIAKAVTDVPLPDDSYFRAIEKLFGKLRGVDKVLLDRERTSVRLVTNAEKMVVNETQRAFLYFCMYGMAVDSVIVNRVLPPEAAEGFFGKWRETQEKYLEQIRDTFAPVPINIVHLFDDEVMGRERLGQLAERVYDDEDPSDVLYRGKPYEFEKTREGYEIRLHLPFVEKENVDLYKDEDQLIVRIAGFKRHIPLPRAVQACEPKHAKFDGEGLKIGLVKQEKSVP
jgi:arsenite-transporting ATPase